ncbi:PAS domain S-box-containing protein [Kineococcus xinjiangensis]|uniref:histidine kinase n=1 Tax=Kineococcus xinjiangensis TaxID=512762 RepID=A0A2S6IGR9_9ACTN|nr:PAS domain S-box protein [Kineococcus xinjiangensis]PPK93391.1 PAS domain S-box-containing protein [Kineococcus xinjiangensis]
MSAGAGEAGHEEGRQPGTDRVSDPTRLAALAATGLVPRPQTPGAPGVGPGWAPALDRLTGLASRLLGAPVTLVSLVDADRQCFVSEVGLTGSLAEERGTPLTHSYCRHVVDTGETLVAPDAREHPLLRGNPAIADYDAIAYLGVPVRTPGGQVLGSLCALDTEPRNWTAADVALLEDLAAAASSEIAARLAAQEALEAATRTQRILETTQDAFISLDGAGRITGWNRAAEALFGWNEVEALGHALDELIIPARFGACHAQGLARAVAAGASALSGRLLELSAVHRGGREFPVELAMTAMEGAGGLTFHAFLRDISARKRSQQLRDVEHDVSQVLLSARSVLEAADAVVRCVGEGLDWHYVEHWQLDPARGRLVRLAGWSGDPAVAAGMGAVADCSLDEGVLGSVLAEGGAQWVTEPGAVACRRSARTEALGLRTCVAIPVRNGEDVDGVLVLFDRRRHAERDTELLASLEALSGHIGQFVHRRRAQDLNRELARTRRDFDRAIANVTDHLWTVQVLPDGRLERVYSSPSGRHVHGGELPADADVLTALTRNLHEDDTAAFAAFHRAVAVEGRRAEVECRVRGVDGRVRWIWFRAAPRHEGEEHYVDGVSTDITGRREAEHALRQQAALLELAPAAIIVRDLASRATYWNRAAQEMYGWEASSALGCVTHRLLDTVFPVSRRAVDEALEAAGRWEGELDHLRADGTRITVLSRQAIQRGPDGAPAAILEFNLDVTDRKRTEQELADNEQRLRTQFSLATVGQATMGLDGAFVQLNPALAAMLGCTVEDLLGRTMDEVTHPDDRAGNRRTAARLFAGDEDSIERTQRLLHAGGRAVDATIGMSLVRDSGGRPRSFVAVVQDVTARLAAERERDAAAAELAQRNRDLESSNTQLAAANVLKLDLMGMLSHEIGGPLTTISGYAEMLLDDPTALDEGTGAGLRAIQRAAARVAELREEVLTMCTLDADRMHANPEPLHVARALAELQAALETDVPVSCPEGLEVLVHPAHFQQVVTNFLSNAAKYGGGAIAVTATVLPGEPGRARIEVHDNGPGVPEELRPHLFERYTRASATRSVSGHGLGLYIVKGLAEANGGTVDHAPRIPSGSTFAVELPLA